MCPPRIIVSRTSDARRTIMGDIRLAGLRRPRCRASRGGEEDERLCTEEGDGIL